MFKKLSLPFRQEKEVKTTYMRHGISASSDQHPHPVVLYLFCLCSVKIGDGAKS